MSKTGLPPPSGDIDRGQPALMVFWSTTAVSIVVVVLRFIGRRMRRGIGLDDWIMLLTLLLHIVFVALLTKAISMGSLRHEKYLTPEVRTCVLKLSWLSQPFAVMGFATGKISVAVLLCRVAGATTFWRKRIIWFVVMLAFVLSVVNVILTFAQCSPMEALWDQRLVEEESAKCLPPSIQVKFAISVSGWSAMTDLLLAVLPATFVCNLNIPATKKCGLCLLLGLGASSAVFAAVKASFLTCLGDRADLTWQTYNLFLWSGLELFVIIVCGSVPPVKPVLEYLFGKRESSTPTDVSGYGRCSSELRDLNSLSASRSVDDCSMMPAKSQTPSARSLAAGSTNSKTGSLHSQKVLQPALTAHLKC